MSIYRNGPVIVFFAGTSDKVLKILTDQLGDPYAVAEGEKPKPMTERPIEPTLQEKFVDSLVKLHEKKDLLGRTD